MDRKEFFEKLAVAKENSGMKSVDISFESRILLPTIRRFEKGTNNSNLNIVCNYMSVINAMVIISKDNKNYYCVRYDNFYDWLLKVRKKEKVSLRKLGEMSGVTFATIASIEAKRTVMSIDTFLKIVTALGYEIEIKTVK